MIYVQIHINKQTGIAENVGATTKERDVTRFFELFATGNENVRVECWQEDGSCPNAIAYDLQQWQEMYSL